MAYNKKAQAAYEKKCKQIKLKLYPNTDTDIAEFLESIEEPTATLIKRLIREEIAKKSKE